LAEREALPPFAAVRVSRRGEYLGWAMLCCRASFLAWVRKLRVLPAFGVSARMRPGFGRKRFSLSALKNVPPAENTENSPISGYGAG
jgi:hypothetical protein